AAGGAFWAHHRTCAGQRHIRRYMGTKVGPGAGDVTCRPHGETTVSRERDARGPARPDGCRCDGGDRRTSSGRALTLARRRLGRRARRPGTAVGWSDRVSAAPEVSDVAAVAAVNAVTGVPDGARGGYRRRRAPDGCPARGAPRAGQRGRT